MTSQTTERAFEDAVEATLLDNGWHRADVSGWNVNTAIFAQQAIDFIKATQPEVWAKIASLNGTQTERQVERVLIRTLDDRGTLDVLRHGFKYSGETLRVAFFKPANDLNPDTLTKYRANRLTISQAGSRAIPTDGHTVDLLFCHQRHSGSHLRTEKPHDRPVVGGRSAPVPETDRDPNAPLFKERKRAVVHFAADYDQIHMATALNRDKTRFLPFNMGRRPRRTALRRRQPNQPGRATTPTTSGKRSSNPTGSLRSSATTCSLRKPSGRSTPKAARRTVTRKTTIFPRYHQLDSVTKLVETAGQDGPGRNYLDPALRRQRQN